MKKMIVGLIVLAIAIGGIVLYRGITSQSRQSDVYIDKNGCAQSRSGGIHPDYCVEQK